MNNPYMTPAHRMPGRDMTEGGQRAFTDVLLKVHHRDGRVVVEYASPGRATYALKRYTKSRFLNDESIPMWVEPVQIKAAS